MNRANLLAGLFAVAVGLVAVISLSFILANERAADVKRACEARNIGRKDIEETFVIVIDALDPDHNSALWIAQPVSAENPTGRPSIISLITGNLGPLPCE